MSKTKDSLRIRISTKKVGVALGIPIAVSGLLTSEDFARDAGDARGKETLAKQMILSAAKEGATQTVNALQDAQTKATSDLIKAETGEGWAAGIAAIGAGITAAALRKKKNEPDQGHSH